MIGPISSNMTQQLSAMQQASAKSGVSEEASESVSQKIAETASSKAPTGRMDISA